MKLWLIIDNGCNWGYSYNIVRAETKEEAAELVSFVFDERNEIIELDPNGPEGILWYLDESPDTFGEE